MKRVKQSIHRAATQKAAQDLLIIPTVIHVIHYGNSGNISDAQVLDGLRVINEDFSRSNADTINTDPLFQPLAANAGFEFRLATVDPNGDPTTGIVRVDTNLVPHPEPVDPDFDNVKFASHWPEDMYFNIWITRSIQGGTYGYAQYPGTGFTYGGPWHTWGPVVRSNQWGTIGTSNSDGRTATHEIGHCFGLYHTFLSTSAGCGTACDTTGDEVCDTPPCQIDFSCNTNNTCPNDTLGPSMFSVDSIDQKENYMSYNSCQNMFSIGQVDRMRGFYYLFDSISDLSLTSNLAATGTMGPVGLQTILPDEDPVSIYPNPATESATIFVPAGFSEGEYVLFSQLGAVLSSGLIRDERTLMEVDGIAKGIYPILIRIDGITHVRKLMID